MKPRHLLALAALVVMALVAAPRRADAGKTWCAAGFERGPNYGTDTGQKTQQDACATSCFRGSEWHQHGYVAKGGQCFSCWDENDQTCETQAPSEGYVWADSRLNGRLDCGTVPIAPPGDPDSLCYPDPVNVVTPTVVTPDPATTTPPAADPSTTQTTPAADLTAIVTPPAKPAPIRMPKPPPPRPTDYEGMFVKIAPGPYAVNTPIRIIAGAKTKSGSPRRVPQGDFVVLDPAGKELQRIHGKPKGRGVVVDLNLSSGGPITLRFEPKSIITAPGEKLATITPAEQTLQVAGCRVEARLDAPVADEILVADAATPLKGHFIDNTGQPASTATLAGATAAFTVEVAGDEQTLPATVDSAGVATGTVTIKRPATPSEVVRIRLIADGGKGDVCPSPAIEAKVTALGVGIDIKPGRPQCYVGLPCPVTARFRLPTAAAARTVGEAFVRSRAMKLTARAAGAPVDLTTDKPGELDGVWHGIVIPGDQGEVMLTAVATAEGKEVKDQTSINVMEPIELRLKGPIDLGTVAAGTGNNKRCATLDFTASRGVVYQRFRLTATRPSGCDSYPTVFDASAGVGYPLYGKGADLEIGDARKVTLCLAGVPRCADESPAPAILTVQALSPDFPDQKADLEVHWKVSGRSFLACWWWLIGAVSGTLFVLMVGYGFIRPYRFGVDDQVQLAGKREQLARAVGRRLRDLPGGRPGWYRSASIGLLENGQATSKLATAVVELHARKGEIVLRSRGGLERVSAQTKKLVPVTDAAGKDGHIASKNVVYSAGALFFQVK